MVDMRQGIAQGVVMPKALIQRVLPQLENVGSDNLETSTYMGPVKKFPSSFSAADKERLTAAYGKLVREQLAPANRKLLAFMRDGPACRQGATRPASAPCPVGRIGMPSSRVAPPPPN
jgi:uncharacterized protein (DUF885 family)